MKKKKWIVFFLYLFLVIGIFLIVSGKKRSYSEAIKGKPNYKIENFNPDSARDWDKMSFLAECSEDRKLALLYRLKALCLEDSENRRRHISQLLGEDWPMLLHFFWKRGDWPTAAFNHSGDKLLVGKRLYDTLTGNQIGEINDDIEVAAADFSPDNRFLLTGNMGSGYSARLWTADTLEPIGKIPGHYPRILAVSFSHEGKRFYTCNREQLRFWSTDDQKELRSPVQFKTRIDFAVFNPDGGMLFVFSSKEGKGVLFRTDTGETYGKPIDIDGEVKSAAFTENGKFLWVSTMYYIKQFEITNGLKQNLDITCYNEAITVDPTGRLIAFYDIKDRTAKIWDWEKNRNFTGFDWDSISETILLRLFSLDGVKLLKSRIYKKGVIEDFPEIMRLTLFSPGGDKLVLSKGDGEARMFQVCKPTSSSIRLEHPNIQKVWFKTASREIITFGAKRFRIWQADNGNAFLKVEIPINLEGVEIKTISADGQWILLSPGCIHSDVAYIWNMSLMQPQGGLFPEKIESATFRQKDNTLITGGEEGILRFRDAATGKEIKKMVALGKEISLISISPNSEDILVNTDLDGIKIIDYSTGKLKGALPDNIRYVKEFVFDPSGGKVLLVYSSSNEDSTKLSLWNMNTMKLMAQSSPPSNPINRYTIDHAFFTPDGSEVIIVTSGKYMHRYKVSNRQFQPVATRFIGGQWFPVGYWFLDKEGNTLQYAIRESNACIRLKTLQWNTYNEKPIQGKPKELLNQWQKRLRIRILMDCTIEYDY
jgi:WD40 repeat protein